MSRSRSRKLDPVIKGVEPTFQRVKGSASLGTKLVLSFEWSGSEFCELSCWILLEKPSGLSILHDIKYSYQVVNLLPSSCSTVVEQAPHHTMVKGSNTAASER
jgi:hypothetical protein